MNHWFFVCQYTIQLCVLSSRNWNKFRFRIKLTITNCLVDDNRSIFTRNTAMISANRNNKSTRTTIQMYYMVWIFPGRIHQFKCANTRQDTIMIGLVVMNIELLCANYIIWWGNSRSSVNNKIGSVRIFYRNIIKNNRISFTKHSVLLEINFTHNQIQSGLRCGIRR